MAKKKTSPKSGSDIAPLIFPAAAILVLYVMWTVLMPPKIGKEISTLVQRQQSLQGSGTTWAQVNVMKANNKKVSDELAIVKESLKATQFQAQNHCGNEIATVDQLKTMGDLDGVLQREGLIITADRTLRERTRMKLAATLQSATDRLLDEIQKSHVTAAKQTRYIPANLPRDVSPDEFFESQNSSARRQSAPDIQLREVELLGTYYHMLEALDGLNQHCGNSLVIGVSVRRPESLTSADSLRLWTLQLQVRPAPQVLPTESPKTSEPLQLAAE